jgi:hypothetical protein
LREHIDLTPPAKALPPAAASAELHSEAR